MHLHEAVYEIVYIYIYIMVYVCVYMYVNMNSYVVFWAPSTFLCADEKV